MSGSFVVVGFIGVHSWSRPLRSWSLGCALMYVGFSRGRWERQCRSWSLGSLLCDLGIIGFFRDRWVNRVAG